MFNPQSAVPDARGASSMHEATRRAGRAWSWPAGFVAALALSGVLSHSLIGDLQRQQARAAESATVERELRGMLQLTVDVDAAASGFALTRDPASLAPAAHALAQLQRSLDTLRTRSAVPQDIDGAIAALHQEAGQRLAGVLAAQADAVEGRPVRFDRLDASRGLQDRIRPVIARVDALEQASRAAGTERAGVLAFGLRTADLLSTLVLAFLGVMWFRARRRLQHAEDNYLHLFSSAGKGMALVASDGRIVQSNAGFAAMLGHDGVVPAGTSLASIEAPAERGTTMAALGALFGGERDVVRCERRYVRRDGAEVWLRSTMSRARDAAFGAPRVLVIAEDVTERVRNEELLRRSSVLLSNAGRMAAIDGWFLALPSGELQLGQHLEQLLRPGPDPSSALRQRLTGRSRRTLLAALSCCRRTGRPFDVRIELDDGARRVLRVLGQPAHASHGVSGIEGAVQDITEQCRVQHSLLKSEQRFRAAAQVSNDGIWDWDIAAGTMWRSRSIAELVGLAEQGLGGGLSAWQALIHPDDRPAARACFVPVIEGGADELRAEYRVRRADGSYAWVQDNARVLRDEKGAIVRMVGTIRDVTERRRMQQAVMGMAASVPAGSSMAYFQVLLRHLLQALGADGGVVARAAGAGMRTIAAQVDAHELAGLEHDPADPPCAQLAMQDELIVPDGMAELYPDARGLPGLRARAFAGRRLCAADGRFLGVMFVMFREPLAESAVLGAALQVFATRAAAELERLDAAARLQEQAALLDHARESITVLGLDLTLRFWNRGAEAMYGFPAEEALGSPVFSCYRDQAVARAALAAVLAHGEWRGESVQLRRDGVALTVDESWTLVRGVDGAPDGILKVGSDVTEKRAAEERVRRMAYYDNLTGLPNRRLLMDRLAQLRLRAARQGRCGALLFVDLDNFKRLNDQFGHDAGDEFLRQAAARLTGCVRADDTVARLGGDEFVILLDGLDADPQAASRQAYAVAASMVTAFRLPVEIGSIVHMSTVSVGAVLVQDDREPVDRLLRRADRAMYRAKNGGRDAIVVAGPDGAEDAPAAPPDGDLAAALRDGQLRLELRAQVDGAGRPAGAAASPRWRQASGRELEGPDLFALAERCALLPSLEAWLLERCAGVLAAWAGLPAGADYRLTLPLARGQLRDPGFSRRLLDLLAAHGCAPGRLVLEVPEAGFEASAAFANVEALRAAGMRLVLADFGLGTSCIDLLRRLVPDGVCLAPRIVRECTRSAVDAELVRTMLELANGMGLPAAADGVADRAQQAFLVQAGCQRLRGPLFGTVAAPVPAAAGAGLALGLAP